MNETGPGDQVTWDPEDAEDLTYAGDDWLFGPIEVPSEPIEFGSEGFERLDD